MKAVFFDRDGTLILDRHYLMDPKDIKLIDRIIPALRLLQQKGYSLFIVTNQSGIGRGLFSEKQYFSVRNAIHTLLKNNGITIKKEYFCPHHPKEAKEPYLQSCECRKPKPGMILEAISEFQIDPKKSFMVGDKLLDIEAGQSAGVESILVRTGYGENSLKNLGKVKPEHIAEDVYDAAVNYILA